MNSIKSISEILKLFQNLKSDFEYFSAIKLQLDFSSYMPFNYGIKYN